MLLQMGLMIVSHYIKLGVSEIIYQLKQVLMMWYELLCAGTQAICNFRIHFNC